jgi:predicted peptidase
MYIGLILNRYTRAVMKKLIGMIYILLSFIYFGCDSSPLEPVEYTQTPVLGSWLLKVDTHGDTFNFYLYIPDDYDQTTDEYPLLFVLHGAFSDRTYYPDPVPAFLGFGPLKPLYVSDTTLDPQGRVNLNSHIKKSFIVYPKVPLIDDSFPPSRLGYWNPDAIDQIVEYLQKNYRINRDRLYITGPSMGGGGTFYYAVTKPGSAAAIIPICNGLPFNQGEDKVKDLPIWLFQCFDDPLVRYDTSICPTVNLMMKISNVMNGYPFTGNKQVAADDYTIHYDKTTGVGPWRQGVVSPNGSFTFTLYRTGGHDAWTATYANDAVWDWLYAQHRN